MVQGNRLSRDVTADKRLGAACALSLALHLLALQIPVSGRQGTVWAVHAGNPLQAEFRSPAIESVQTAPPAPDALVVANTVAEKPPSMEGVSAPEEGIGVASRYFKSSEVDRRAEPIDISPLLYPETAYRRRLPGKVVVRIYVSETGNIDTIDVLEAVPPGVFEQAAVDALLATRFRPAELLGRPVKNVKTIEIGFDPGKDGEPPTPLPPAPSAAEN